MSRLLILGLIALLFLLQASSQPCLPEGIELNSQEQINNFQLHHPACTEIGGDVIVRGGDITNLGGLIKITRIEGDLWICYNPELSSLSGLGNLTFIGGNFSLGDRNYSGQPWNPSLENIDALNKLEQVGGDLELYNNTSLTSLHGLDNLMAVGGKLRIGGNSKITDLQGLNKLESVGASLLIDVNHSLDNLSGLDKLTTIGGSLGIYNNPSLSSLAGLHHIQEIDGTLWIELNDHILNLSGLEDLNAGSIKNLSITSNSALSACEVKSVCDYLLAPGGLVEISNNAAGCNSQEEVEIDCQDISVEENDLQPSIMLYPNPVSGELHLRYSIPDTRDSKLEMYSAQGVLLKALKQGALQKGDHELEIDVSHLPDGLYFLNMNFGNYYIIKKLVVIH